MNNYKEQIEKIARRLLDDDLVRDTINRHIVNSNPDVINKDVSHSKAYRGLSMPWNENVQVETYLKDKNNQGMTANYFLKDEDGPIITNLVRKGVPFSSKTREKIIIPNEIRLKDQYKKRGIGSNVFFAVENAGKELGANRLEIVPDDEGASVWGKPKYGLSISKPDSKEFNRAAKKYYKQNKGMKAPKSLSLSDHDKHFVDKFLSDNRMFISLDKDINKQSCDYALAIEKVAKAKSEFQKLKDNEVDLTPEEKKVVRDKKAVWSGGNLAVWKSVDKDGNVTYITHTHRAWNKAPTLKGAISRFHNFIKSTS